MDLIVARLAEFGLQLAPPASTCEWHDPKAIVSQMGFVADQTRTTRRRPRDVSRRGNPTIVLAEVAVDSVVYHLRSGAARHHEIEVELKDDGTVEDIQEVTQALLASWPNSMRTWQFGKRSTGRAVESLLKEHGPSGILSAAGDLLPKAYDSVYSRLQ
jgi:hypothetical protein